VRRLALIAAAAALAGCGAPRSGAVSEIGPCAQVLPLAAAHAPKAARLSSVRALKRGGLRPLIRKLDAEVPSGRPPEIRRRRGPPVPRKGCLLVYTGHFRPGGELRGPGPGRYLVLVIRVRHPRLLRAVVVDRLPPAVAKAR
jgi:hypothetical protein